MSKPVYRANGISYVRFGILKDFNTENGRITIVNEDDETRIKSKIYASWTTTVKKLSKLIGQDIITSTSASNPSDANYLFSDVWVNRKYNVKLYDAEGNVEKTVQTDLLQMPKINDPERPGVAKTAHEQIIQARIDTQKESFNVWRQAEWEYADVQEQNQLLQEEQANLSKRDKDAHARWAKEVEEAVPKWIKEDKMRPFRIVGDRGPTGSSLTHFDREIAMRYRIDTTKLSRLQVAVRQYVNGNFILCDIVDPNGEGIRSLPQSCIMAVIKLHDQNAWQVKTVRPMLKSKTWYRLERHFLGDNKDTKQPIEFWFDIYDKVSAEMYKDAAQHLSKTA